MVQDSGNPKGDFPILPNEFAWIMSRESGKIKCAVGPIKVQIGQNEEIVEFDSNKKAFVVLNERRAQKLVVIPKGWYAVLTNPATDNKGQPNPGETQEIDPKQLQVGIKVVIPGEKSFALWPGQMVKIIEGHTLQSNEFLLCRVYDEAAARENASKAVIKTVDPAGEAKEPAKDGGKSEPEAVKPETTVVDKKEDKVVVDPVKDLISKAATGQRLIIKGNAITFFIPSTGVEVLKEGSSYVRQAVTLEELEYCVLVSERGIKRFCHGPAIVFPEADESFMTSPDGYRKFRAIDLNAISGIYVKVIRAYEGKDKDGKPRMFKEGEELFITGEDQPFYFPRPEHSLISYGESPVHFAIAVPKGDGRYVLGRMTSEIRTEKGPKMLLLDPRQDVAVRRVLTPGQVKLWFPGNVEAEQVNEQLRKLKTTDAGFVTERTLKSKGLKSSGTDRDLEPSLRHLSMSMLAEPVSDSYGGEEISRKATFTPPPTVTINSKFEGAVKMNVWSGYAVMVKDSTGKRRVVKGPQPVILEYDEEPEVLRLSTGKPKNTDRLLETIYLLTTANKVSDEVTVETLDFCKVSLKLSYRVNFEGDPEKWWNVENYVKLISDHLRSLLKNMAKRHKIEELYSKAIDLIRDTILGKAEDKGERPGRLFAENGARVYDVEVLGIEILDGEIASELRAAQKEAVEAAIQKTRLEVDLERTKQEEAVKRAQATEVNETKLAALCLQVAEATAREKASQEVEKAKTLSALAALKNKEELSVAQQELTLKAQEQETAAKKLAIELKSGLELLIQANNAALAIKADEEKARSSEASRKLAELNGKAQIALHEEEIRAELALKEEEWKNIIDFREKLAGLQKDLETASAAADVSRLQAITPKLVEALEGLGNKELATALATHLPAAGGTLGLLTGRAGITALKELVKGTQLEAGLNALTADPEEAAAEAKHLEP